MLKFIFLLLIREVYLFSRNLLGLIFHPYKTLRAIRREEDFSQAFLLAGFPLQAIFTSLLIFILARFIFHFSGRLATLLYIGLLVYWFIGLLVLLYLVYWLLLYWKISRRIKTPTP